MSRHATARRPVAARWLVLVWVLATAVGLLVAVSTKIGPILLRVTPQHGVHLGDVATFVLSYGVALIVTRRQLQR
jgi:hypothetical protein